MIRQATELDIHRIVELWYEMSVYHEQIDSYFKLAPDGKSVYRNFLSSHIGARDVALFVAEDEGVVKGYVMVKVEIRPAVFLSQRTGFIQELAVTEDFQRMGVGQELLTKALTWLKEQGISEVSCHYSLDNPKSSKFWSEAGFKVTTVTGTIHLNGKVSEPLVKPPL